jgi:fucose 4-O-acetylase-like acetyltransferase
VRNIYHNTPLFGERMDSALNLQGSIEQFVRQLGVYVIPPETTSLSFVLGGVLIAGLIASLWLIFVNRVNVLYPTSLMFVVIWSGVVWSQTTTRLDVNPERLGSPAFVAVIVLSLFVLDVLTRTINVQFSRRIHKQTNALGNLIAVFVVLLVVLSNFINSLRFIG